MVAAAICLRWFAKRHAGEKGQSLGGGGRRKRWSTWIEHNKQIRQLQDREAKQKNHKTGDNERMAAFSTVMVVVAVG